MDEKERQLLNELSNNANEKSKNLIVHSLKLLSPSERGQGIVCFLICSVVSLLMSIGLCSKNIYLFYDCVKLINNTFLVIFSVSFTAFSIFQALISDEIVIDMINASSTKDESICDYTESNKYFVTYMLLCFIVIISSFIILLTQIIFPEKWVLFQNNMQLSTLFAGIFAFIYFFVSISTLIETKSFVTNMYQMYFISALKKYLDYIKKKNN